jgi:hypothetical protein
MTRFSTTDCIRLHRGAPALVAATHEAGAHSLRRACDGSGKDFTDRAHRHLPTVVHECLQRTQGALGGGKVRLLDLLAPSERSY